MIQKYLLFTFAFLFASTSIAGELPKSCFGNYGGEMPNYTVEKNGVVMEIAAHDVFICITPDIITYKGGSLSLSGTYSVFKQNKQEYVIKASLTNGKSLNYEMEFIWNKKEKLIYLTPKNGESEAILEPIDG